MLQSHKLNTYRLIIICLLTTTASAGEWNKNQKNVVLDGHDLVAYHQLDKPVKGRGMFQTEFDGVKFYFSSAANHKAFTENPQKHLPK